LIGNPQDIKKNLKGSCDFNQSFAIPKEPSVSSNQMIVDQIGVEEEKQAAINPSQDGLAAMKITEDVSMSKPALPERKPKQAESMHRPSVSTTDQSTSQARSRA